MPQAWAFIDDKYFEYFKTNFFAIQKHYLQLITIISQLVKDLSLNYLVHLNSPFIFLFYKNTDNYNYQGLQEDSGTYLTLNDYYS